MNIQTDHRVLNILEQASTGKAPSEADCAFLLAFHEVSPEAAAMRAAAHNLTRTRFANAGMLLGQIGVEIAPCAGKCKFCSFSEEYTAFDATQMTNDELLTQADAFTRDGELYALFLMTMHKFDFERLLQRIELVRQAVGARTQIVVNIGDFTRDKAQELKSAGVSGAYHIRRLREGVDTAILPDHRLQTIEAIHQAGLDWYNCCEPIGPEHSPEELARQMCESRDLECFQHAAMRRVAVPGSRLAVLGQISEIRLAQVVAVVTLSQAANPQLRSIAVHEPNIIGLASGANTVYAESGANPRDIEENTSGHRGKNLDYCKTLLREAGYDALMQPDGNRPL
jgi:biotin synthase